MLQFERYYDEFLRNGFRGRRYRITLNDGRVLEGVPMAGSIADPRNPDVDFAFKGAGPGVRIRFADLVRAEPL